MSRNSLLVAALVARTDGSLQGDDLVECDVVTDVESVQHGGLYLLHSRVGLARDQDDAVDLFLELVDPVRHELAVEAWHARVAEVDRVLLLADEEGQVANVVPYSQLDDVLVRMSPISSMTALTL